MAGPPKDRSRWPALAPGFWTWLLSWPLGLQGAQLRPASAVSLKPAHGGRGRYPNRREAPEHCRDREGGRCHRLGLHSQSWLPGPSLQMLWGHWGRGCQPENSRPLHAVPSAAGAGGLPSMPWDRTHAPVMPFLSLLSPSLRPSPAPAPPCKMRISSRAWAGRGGATREWTEQAHIVFIVGSLGDPSPGQPASRDWTSGRESGTSVHHMRAS